MKPQEFRINNVLGNIVKHTITHTVDILVMQTLTQISHGKTRIKRYRLVATAIENEHMHERTFAPFI